MSVLIYILRKTTSHSKIILKLAQWLPCILTRNTTTICIAFLYSYVLICIQRPYVNLLETSQKDLNENRRKIVRATSDNQVQQYKNSELRGMKNISSNLSTWAKFPCKKMLVFVLQKIGNWKCSTANHAGIVMKDKVDITAYKAVNGMHNLQGRSHSYRLWLLAKVRWTLHVKELENYKFLKTMNYYTNKSKI